MRDRLAATELMTTDKTIQGSTYNLGSPGVVRSQDGLRKRFIIDHQQSTLWSLFKKGWCKSALASLWLVLEARSARGSKGRSSKKWVASHHPPISTQSSLPLKTFGHLNDLRMYAAFAYRLRSSYSPAHLCVESSIRHNDDDDCIQQVRLQMLA